MTGDELLEEVRRRFRGAYEMLHEARFKGLPWPVAMELMAIQGMLNGKESVLRPTKPQLHVVVEDVLVPQWGMHIHDSEEDK